MTVKKVSFEPAPMDSPDAMTPGETRPQEDTKLEEVKPSNEDSQVDYSRLLELREAGRLVMEADELFNRNMMELESSSRERVQKIRPGGTSVLSREACLIVERLWVTFRAAALGKGDMECPTIDDVLQFLDAMAQHPVSDCAGHMKPLLFTLKRIQSHLIKILRFQYFDFEFRYGKTGAARAKALMEGLVYKGELVKERSAVRKRFAARLTHIIARTWISRALTEGCISWDRVWVTLAALLLEKACCVDDSNTSARVPLNWGDIRIALQPGELSVRNLKASIRIRYVHRKSHAVYYGRILNFHGSLDDGKSYSSIIPVLLVLALRFHQVRATSIGQLLEQASEREDRTIQWLHPVSPVLSMILATEPAKVQMGEHSMVIVIFDKALWQMGVASGILQRRDVREARMKRQGTADDIYEMNTATADDRHSSAVARVQAAIIEKWRTEGYETDTENCSVQPPDVCPMDKMKCLEEPGGALPIDGLDAISVDGEALKALKGIILGIDDSAEREYSDGFIVAGYNYNYAANKYRSEVGQVLAKQADDFVGFFSGINNFVMRGKGANGAF